MKVEIESYLDCLVGGWVGGWVGGEKGREGGSCFLTL